MSGEWITRESRLAVPAEVAWEWATTPERINDELRPLARMTIPRALRGRTIEPSAIPLGEPLGRSWILLGGLLPVDYDDLCLVELEPPRRFLERSRTLSFSTWQHERVIEPEGDGCLLIDRLRFDLKPALRWLPGAAALARAVVGALFTHRHRRLRRRDTGRR